MSQPSAPQAPAAAAVSAPAPAPQAPTAPAPAAAHQPSAAYTTEGLLKRLQELQRELEEERGKHAQSQSATSQAGASAPSVPTSTIATPEPVRSTKFAPSPLSPSKSASVAESEADAHTLQEEVQRLRREKVALENQLEQESEYVVHKLAKEKEAALTRVAREKDKAIEVVAKEKEKVVEGLCKEKEQLVHDKEMLQRQLRRVAPEAASHLLHELSTEVLRLRQLLISSGRAENEAELDRAAEVERLRQENRHLRQKVSTLTQRVHELESMSVELDRQAEIDDERMFNISRSYQSGIATPPRTTTPSFHGPSPNARDFPLSSSPATTWPHGRTFSFGSSSRPRSASINSETGANASNVGGPHIAPRDHFSPLASSAASVVGLPSSAMLKNSSRDASNTSLDS